MWVLKSPIFLLGVWLTGLCSRVLQWDPEGRSLAQALLIGSLSYNRVLGQMHPPGDSQGHLMTKVLPHAYAFNPVKVSWEKNICTNAYFIYLKNSLKRWSQKE